MLKIKLETQELLGKALTSRDNGNWEFSFHLNFEKCWLFWQNIAIWWNVKESIRVNREGKIKVVLKGAVLHMLATKYISNPNPRVIPKDNLNSGPNTVYKVVWLPSQPQPWWFHGMWLSLATKPLIITKSAFLTSDSVHTKFIEIVSTQ